MDGAITVQIELDFVLTRREPEALEGSVEIVDDAGVVTVNEHFGLARLDFQADRGVRDVVPVWSVRGWIGPRIVEPEPRIVVPRTGVVTHPDDDGMSRGIVVMPLRRPARSRPCT